MRKFFVLLLLSLTTLLASQIGVVQGLNPYGDGFLSLRIQPKSTEIGKLYNGDALQILDRNGKYYKVKDIESSKVGWAHSNWIKTLGTNKNEIVVLVPPGGDPGQGGDGVKFLLKGEDGSFCSGWMASGIGLESTNCIRSTNVKRRKVLCTKKQGGLCKTEDEVYKDLLRLVNN